LENTLFVVVDVSVLPDVFARVLEAKKLLTMGEKRSVAEAAQSAGVSRSAFYKYRDSVFAYKDHARDLVTLSCVLVDRPGVLSGVLGCLHEGGANILTLNQNIPTGGFAQVSLSVSLSGAHCAADELIHRLSALSGMKSIEQLGV